MCALSNAITKSTCVYNFASILEFFCESSYVRMYNYELYKLVESVLNLVPSVIYRNMYK